MVEHVGTVPTQAFQVWLTATTQELGWPWPLVEHVGLRRAVRHLGRHVASPGSRAVARRRAAGSSRTSAMRCTGPRARRAAPDPAYAATARGRGEGQRHRVPSPLGSASLARGGRSATGEFRWELLSGGGAARDAARFDSQFWRANVDPSDHYVLSLPGTGRHRIKPGETGFDNLVIAGDWTDCGLNAGCVEAAVMSGRLAAHALTGAPRLEDIVGYPRP